MKFLLIESAVAVERHRGHAYELLLLVKQQPSKRLTTGDIDGTVSVLGNQK
jgi:hypothetical protein